MKRGLVLMGVLYATIAYSQDGDWQLLFINPVGDCFYYDQASIKHGSNSTVTVRLKGSGADEAQKVREFVHLLEIDCHRQTYRRVQGQFIFRNGSMSPELGASEWHDIDYGSYLDKLSQLTCEKTKGRRSAK